MTGIYACLMIPDYPAAILQRLQQEETRPPVAVFEGLPPYRKVVSANAAARSGGVRIGIPLSAATARFAARCPGKELLTLERDQTAEQQIWKEMLHAALHSSPLIESDAPGFLFANLTGQPDPHHAARQLRRDAKDLGLLGNVGVSLNRFVAECAARSKEGVTHVFPGQEQAFLHELPLRYLPLDEDTRQTLSRWGIRTLGSFAALPERDVVDRLGAPGAQWLRMARGQYATVFHSHAPEEEFIEDCSFEWQVVDLESLSFRLSEMLHHLCQRLQRRSLAVGKLRIGLRLASGYWQERELLLPTAHTDAKTFLTLARLNLSANPPGEPIEGLRVHIEPAPQRTSQFSLFEPVQPSPEKLDVTLARLHRLVSMPGETESRVGSPMVIDSHRYDSYHLVPFSPPKAQIIPSAEKIPLSLHMVLRCFRPAPEAEVHVAQSKPVYVHAPGLCKGEIQRTAGPWKIGGEWWTDEPWDFEEWDVSVGKQLYRIRCELPSLLWRVAGVYD